jgi:large subunit ribosomal protein L3
MSFRMGLLGKKIGNTQSFDATGACVDLAVVETGPCVILDIKTADRDGYCSLQLGFDEKRERSVRKPQAGLFAKVKTSPKKFIREIRLSPEEAAQFEVGQTLSLGQVFTVGDFIDATGVSKGKGVQGVMKRYHFRGFKASHGTHEYFRHGGSIGCRLTPGRVVRGKKMPGQMGNKRVTVQNIKVVEVLEDKNLLLLGGAVPGAPDGYLVLKQAAKRPARPVRFETATPSTNEAPAADEAPAEA